MNRYKITIEYDGTDFVGWQKQDNGQSIQSVIEKAIKDFSGEEVTVHAAGRTDAGVHAIGQVAHFEISKRYKSSEVLGALNYYTKPFPVSITESEIVDAHFHARFSAQERSYIYKIINRKAKLVLEKNRAWHIPSNLDLEAMSEACKYFIGKHDFTSFRATMCQAHSPIKTVNKLEILQKDEEIIIYISAKSFLHHMVRNIVGTLVLVGQKKLNPNDIEKIILAKDRRKAGQTAPACGLYFYEVRY